MLYILRGLPDAYAMWNTGDLVVDYMGKHADRWPSGWEDLRPSFEACKKGDEYMRGGLTFDEIRNRIEIDWKASPQNALLHRTPFKSITARSANHTIWEGAEPNEMIIQYLRKSGAAPATHSSTTNASQAATQLTD